MQLMSSGIHDGYFADCYGGYGTAKNQNGVPTESIPFQIEFAPKEAVSFAAIFYDLDAFEVTQGFPWIHWTLANLTQTVVPANASQHSPGFVQGINSWHSPLADNQSRELSSYYGGMTPPNRDHTYTLQVFALDCRLDLTDGFFLNELTHQLSGHVLATAVLNGQYRQYRH